MTCANVPWLVRLAAVVVLAVAAPGPPTAAAVRLPAIFSDHMVLQGGREGPIWGWADPGEEITVTIADQTVSTRAGSDGKWKLRLPSLEAGGPHTLEVKGGNTLAVKDVLVGEVWLGSGQSNMAMAVSRAKDFEQERTAATWPQIRMFMVTSGPADMPQEDCEGEWVVCAPQTVGRFSATLYFFGRELHRDLNVPVGLINSSVGGTPIESWISEHAQRSTPQLAPYFQAVDGAAARFDAGKAKSRYDRELAAWKEATRKAEAAGQPPPPRPRDPIAIRQRRGDVGDLFNGKIAPLIPYSIRGILWYQGEANTAPIAAPYYEHQLPLLVKDWRSRWGAELPIAWVQLPNFAGEGRDWPVVREAMLKTLALPNTGMAITIDIGQSDDIHPQNKQDVGKRLAMWALGSVYGKEVVVSGPLPKSAARRDSAIVVSFKHAEGLEARGGDIRGFELAGSDGIWKPATAAIERETVVVTSAEVAEPTGVRYGWANDPDVNLYNAAGLPASPFQFENVK